MAKQVKVLGENRRVKRSVAQLLVNRLIADWIVYNVSIQMKPLRQFNPSPIAHNFAPISPKSYEHHIEPRIVQFTASNSDWLRYLNG